MNDFAFGATLLSCFAILLAAVALETTLPPPPVARAAACRLHGAPAHAQPARAACCDCTTVARADAHANP